jgi:hypothetical protein
MLKHAALFSCCLLALLLTGCPPAKPAGSSSAAPAGTAAAGKPSAPALKAHGLTVCLVRTDLGLGDGSYVRELDELLVGLAKDGQLTYLTAGKLPEPMIVEASSYDVGLPLKDSEQPGTMTTEAAVALLDEVKPCGWLVLTSPALVDPALERIQAGKFTAQAIILLDEEGWAARPENPPVPVISARYQIKEVAFLLGVAAAQSANNQQYVAMAISNDPQAEEFLHAVSEGAKYQTNGAVTLTATLDADPQTGLVTPETFRTAFERIKERAGAAFAANHFILALGRTTPTIMYAMTQKPINGYVLGGYADYRQIRPARVVGCAVKHPAVMLRYMLEHAATAPELAQLAPQGYVELGLRDGAITFTDFDLYSRYNPDGDDIKEAVENVQGLIKADELDYEY